ncbi:carbohydrate ABC transporter permease [Streptomyces sp. NPDC002926]
MTNGTNRGPDTPDSAGARGGAGASAGAAVPRGEAGVGEALVATGSAGGPDVPGPDVPGPDVPGPRTGTSAAGRSGAVAVLTGSDPQGAPEGPRSARKARTARSSRRGQGYGGRTPWLYLAPALLVLGGLLVYPIYQLGLISLLEYTQAQVSGGEPTTFQGLGNYRTLLADSQFWQVLLATLVFAASCVVTTLAVGCGLAVLLTRVRALPRLALMLAALGAWATPAITGSTVWVFLFDPDHGPVNRLLGLGDFSWTYGRYSAFALVLLEVVWCSFPFVMVTVYAGIKAIPPEVLEAASLDGATQWRTWRSVTAPMLRPILVVVTIQSVIWDFKVFTQIYVMTNGGGIAGQNLVLNVYAYQKAFASSQYSLGSAIGVVMLLILLAVTLVYLRLLRRQGEEL